MEKAQRKKEDRLKRQREDARRRKRNRVIVWSVSVLFVAVVAALAIFWPKPGPLDLAYDQMPRMGAAEAKVKLTEFGDFKCPTCARFNQEIFSKIKAEYVDTGKVAFYYQNFPIIGPDSYTAAQASLSIHNQNHEAFWTFNEALFANQQDERAIWATPEFLVDFAKQLQLPIDYDQLKLDLDNGTYASAVNDQYNFAVAHKFTGTPTLLLDGVKLDNNTALSYDNLKAAIDEALQDAEG